MPAERAKVYLIYIIPRSEGRRDDVLEYMTK